MDKFKKLKESKVGKDTATHLEIIEQIYGKDYGVKHDIGLRAYLKKHGYAPLADLLCGDEEEINKNS